MHLSRSIQRGEVCIETENAHSSRHPIHLLRPQNNSPKITLPLTHHFPVQSTQTQSAAERFTAAMSHGVWLGRWWHKELGELHRRVREGYTDGGSVVESAAATQTSPSSAASQLHISLNTNTARGVCAVARAGFGDLQEVWWGVWLGCGYSA